jgi:hypothetical protein
LLHLIGSHCTFLPRFRCAACRHCARWVPCRRRLPVRPSAQQLLTSECGCRRSGARGDSIPLDQVTRPHSSSRAGWMSYGAYDSNVAGSVAALWNAGAVSGKQGGACPESVGSAPGSAHPPTPAWHACGHLILHVFLSLSRSPLHAGTRGREYCWSPISGPAYEAYGQKKSAARNRCGLWRCTPPF